MLGEIFERFVKKAPAAVMVRGILERVLGPEALNELYERVVEKQYTKTLLFSSVFQLMNLVVCKVQPSIHAPKNPRSYRSCENHIVDAGVSR